MSGKRIRDARKKIDNGRLYSIAEAVALVKGNALSRFDETVDVAVNLGVDPRHADQMVRGVVRLPNGSGRSVRVAVFAKGKKAEEAKNAGADLVGAEDLVGVITGGKIEFDRCIATPDMMSVVGRLGKILGPRGLMPNPKVGSVTQDVASAVSDFKSGLIEFRVEKSGVVHAGIGKVSFASEAIEENIRVFGGALLEARPSAAKGVYMQSFFISSSMGPAVKIDPSGISAV